MSAAIQVGKTYLVNSSRKGKFTGKLVSVNDTWATIKITSGKALAILHYNEREKGEEVTVRREWCSFTEVLTNRVRTVGDQFQIKHMGRWFCVVARFPNTPDGTKEANDFMVANPDACVLVVADGWINLSQYSDKGQAE